MIKCSQLKLVIIFSLRIFCIDEKRRIKFGLKPKWFKKFYIPTKNVHIVEDHEQFFEVQFRLFPNHQNNHFQ